MKLGPFTLPESYTGDCRELMAQLPNESIQCVVTSPPYWGLRDYGAEGQLGLEQTPEQYVSAMVDVFEHVRRVLRADGTLWLNLGDSYASDIKGSGGVSHSPLLHGSSLAENNASVGQRFLPRRCHHGLKPKDLVGIPWRVAFALQAAGWYLRSDIIWAKPNPMPESVTDRPTKSHEYIFLLTKSARYYYDAEAVREESITHDPRRPYAPGQVDKRGSGHDRGGGTQRDSDVTRRNKRTVWTVNSLPYKGAHFAVFPPMLIEPCILAGSPVRACAGCGAPWQRIVEVEYANPGNRTTNGPRSLARRHEKPGFAQRLERRSKTTGWRAGCECGAEHRPGVVLDPFFGSGTTGEVAEKHGRLWLGFDISDEYKKLQDARTSQRSLPMVNE